MCSLELWAEWHRMFYVLARENIPSHYEVITLFLQLTLAIIFFITRGQPLGYTTRLVCLSNYPYE